MIDSEKNQPMDKLPKTWQNIYLNFYSIYFNIFFIKVFYQ